ncbi:MAG TPA: restriction endonuclease [Acinetobacter junii]|nr:restriction endonuclease [Acinetobacter junii]
MAAKKLALVVCTLGLLQTSFASSERFWVFSKPNKPTTDETWEDLSPEEQQLLIKRYQTLKEIPTNQSTQLQQRMEWFTQLPEEEKQKMRDVWQKMNTQERNTLRKRMQNASIEERVSIREEYLSKYAEH